MEHLFTLELQARVFVNAKKNQPSLIFLGKAILRVDRCTLFAKYNCKHWKRIKEGATTLSITTLRIMTLRIQGLFVTFSIMTLSMTILWHDAECHYVWCFVYCHAECHYAKCHYAKCHYAKCHNAKCHYAKCHYAKCHVMSLAKIFLQCLIIFWEFQMRILKNNDGHSTGNYCLQFYIFLLTTTVSRPH